MIMNFSIWPSKALALGFTIFLLFLVSESQGGPPGIIGESQTNNGVVGWTGSTNKSGVYGHSQAGSGVTGRSDEKSGVVGWTGAADSPAVLGHTARGNGVIGRSDNNDGVVGWTGSHEKSGVFGHSQKGVGVAGISGGNDGLLGVTQSNEPGHAGIRARNEGNGPAAFIEGDLFVTGAIRGDIGPKGGAPFPRPAYDSGWVTISKTGTLVGVDKVMNIDHNLGENPDNYVVDLQFRSKALGVHQYHSGGTNFTKGSLRKNNVHNGAWWTRLTDKSITVHRGSSDKYTEELRVRIWVYR